MIAIIDYGVGNLFSLSSSLKCIGAESVITADPEVIRKADKVILPGVGAFGDAVNKLRETGLDKIVIEQAESGKPLMGICLGMQLLFEKGYEYGVHEGLGLLKGNVVPIIKYLIIGLWEKSMKAMESDWYKKIWTLDIQNQSWVEDTNRQVNFLTLE